MRIFENPFDVLGIEATTDRKIIRQAYAERVKSVHPEDDPEGWKLLHDAYRAAMQMAEAGGSFHPGERWEQEASFSSSGENVPEWAETAVSEPDEEMHRVFHDIHDLRTIDLIDAKEQLAALFVYDRRQMRFISRGVSKQKRWDLFFASDLFERLRRDEAFWELLQDVVRDRYVDKEVCHEVQKKLLELLNEEQTENCRKKILRIMAVLPDRITQKKFSIRNYSRRTIVTAAVWILVMLALFVWRMTNDPVAEMYEMEPELTTEQVQAGMASHLNEKYGTDLYDAEDFTVSMTASYYVYRYGTDGYVHRVKMADNPDFEGCIVEYEDGGEARGFDNLQGSQIEAALKDDLISQGIMSQGRMTLYETEEYNKLWQPEEEEAELAEADRYCGYPVYHTLYEEEAGIEVFVAEEKERRMAWLHYEELPDNLEGDEEDPWCIDMGRITIYAPDSVVTSISDWVTGKPPGGAGTLSEQSNVWEKAFGMRLSMVTMPRSLYEKISDMEQLPCLDDVNTVELAGIVSGEWSLQTGADFSDHLTLPYGTGWYMWAAEYEGTVQQFDEGIFIGTMDAQGSDCKLQMKPMESGRALKLKVTAETTRCIVLTISEEVFGIDGGDINVFRQDEGKEKTEMPCVDIRSYLDFGNDGEAFAAQYQMVLREEGYLLIPYIAGGEKDTAEIIIVR